MKLMILKMRKQVFDSILYLFFVRIFKSHCPLIKYSAALAAIFVAQNSFAIPIPSSSRQFATDQVDVREIGLLAEWTQLGELLLKHRSNSLNNVDQLFPLRQLQGVPIIQASADEQTKNKGKDRKQPGVQPDESINFIKHYPGLSMIAFNLLLGISLPLILGFAAHARKHGINNAWRDLVFTWPIPYWMRFVPKDEQGLP